IQMRGYTGDVLTGGGDQIWQLNERGYLEKVDWAKIGVPKQLTPSSFAMVTTASMYVIAWNKRVMEVDTPKTWDEVADPKWSGRMGSWVRASAFAELASSWGVPKARAL